MEVNDFVIVMRSLTWFVMTWCVWLGLRDYFEARYKRQTKRWNLIKVGLGIVVVANFAIFVFAVAHGLGVV